MMPSMRLVATACFSLAVASCGKAKPQDIGPLHEVRTQDFTVKVGGPIELEAHDTILTGFMTVENVSKTDVRISIDGCGMYLDRGERRGCYTFPTPGANPAGSIYESKAGTEPVRMKLTEAKLERTAPGHARFTAFIANPQLKGSIHSAQARFDVVDQANHLVGAGDAMAAKSTLAPGEVSIVEADVLLVKGASGKLSLYDPVGQGQRIDATSVKEEPRPKAELVELKLQTTTKNKQVAALLVNQSGGLIEPSARFYLKDKKNRTIASDVCEDRVRLVAPLPVPPNERIPCTALHLHELPAYDHLEVEAKVGDAMYGAPVTFSPLTVKEVKVDNGMIRVTVDKPTPKMALYIRAQPDWLYIDYANDKTPYEYRLDGATAATVTAFAVSGPPNENWIPIRQFGKSD